MSTVKIARGLTAAAAVGALAASVALPAGSADARRGGPPTAVALAKVTPVTVAGMAFTPASVSTTLGGSVTWTFPEAIGHTTTSNQGFWDSGTKLGGATFTHTFTSAGTFAYHCSIHPMMTGRVNVPPTASGSAGSGYRLSWATVKGSGGITYDVQTRLGAGRWVALKTGVAGSHARFDPAKAGKYQVRARTAKGGARSGWSPTVTVTIS
jgi:plastocyanin